MSSYFQIDVIPNKTKKHGTHYWNEHFVVLDYLETCVCNHLNMKGDLLGIILYAHSRVAKCHLFYTNQI